MKLEDEILINKYGQGISDGKELLYNFKKLDMDMKRAYLTNMKFLILQAKPNNDDFNSIILDSKLKSTFTPCVILKKGITDNNLNHIIALPENELNKVFLLFLSSFKIPYQRRFNLEKNHPDKWWYWDLSDERKINEIRKKSTYF